MAHPMLGQAVTLFQFPRACRGLQGNATPQIYLQKDQLAITHTASACLFPKGKKPFMRWPSTQFLKTSGIPPFPQQLGTRTSLILGVPS